jgi:hypothetical protein
MNLTNQPENLPVLTAAKKLSCGLAASLFVFLTSSLAQAQESAPGVTNLFSDDSILGVSITAPWKKITRNKDNQNPYPATIQWKEADGSERSVAITVERRGITRQIVCDFPPIKLRFDKSSVEGTVFEGQSSLKMVTHCDRTDRNVQYYIKEMLAYKVYNVITEKSFRIRQLEATYVDSDTNKENGPLFAFLIEDDKHVAKRNGQKKLKIGGLKIKQLDPLETSKFMLFQYLIGNLDWSALSGPDKDKCCHNGKLIGLDPATDPVFAIPYDFDSSGLVDAHYAVPQEKLRVRNIKQRLYRGFCPHNDYVDPARELFLSNQGEINAIIENEPLLDKYPRKTSLSYFAQFFKRISDADKFKKEVEKNCRG